MRSASSRRRSRSECWTCCRSSAAWSWSAQPSERDLASPEIRPYIEKLLPSNGLGTAERVRLFRLAHDVCMSAFATRQEVYEYWHRGDVTRNRTNLYLRYNRGQVVDRINELLSKPM